MHRKLALLLILSVSPIQAFCHEFWIEPDDYVLDTIQPVTASVKSGEYFEGLTYPYMPARIINAKLVNKTGQTEISGIAGEFPAIKVNVPSEGLQIISYQSAASSLVHDSFDDFLTFLEEDGLTWVEQAHRDRKLPENGFAEQFSRYAKALISVGDGEGTDVVTGMPLEIIALNNPYTTQADIVIQLLDNGNPVPDSQVTVFQRLEGEKSDTEPMLIRTDEQGKAVIPRGNGGIFLVSSVVMKEGVLAPWHSHWASITYRLPENL